MTNRGDIWSVVKLRRTLLCLKSTMAFRKQKTKSATGARSDASFPRRKISSASAHPVSKMAISAIELATKPATPTSSMTGEELVEYKSIFQMFDKHNNGSITAPQFAHATKSMGLYLNAKEVEAAMAEMDKNKNGAIDFEEFCIVMKKMSSKKNSWDEVIKQCFDVFDRIGSGVIRETEFHDILRDLGGIHDEVLIEEIFNQADVDGNGVIEYEEFASFCKNYLTDEDVEPPVSCTPR